MRGRLPYEVQKFKKWLDSNNISEFMVRNLKEKPSMSTLQKSKLYGIIKIKSRSASQNGLTWKVN